MLALELLSNKAPLIIAVLFINNTRDVPVIVKLEPLIMDTAPASFTASLFWK